MQKPEIMTAKFDFPVGAATTPVACFYQYADWMIEKGKRYSDFPAYRRKTELWDLQGKQPLLRITLPFPSGPAQ